MAASLTLKSFVIPFSNAAEEECVAFIPQPSEAEMIAMAKSLGYIFSRFKNAVAEGSDFLVVVKDWKIMLDEHLGSGEKAEAQKKQLAAFFDRRILLANIFNKETGEVVKAELVEDEAVMHEIKGMLLFFVAALRYAPQLLKMKELLEYTTLLSASEMQMSLKKSAAQREESQTKERSQKALSNPSPAKTSSFSTK